MIKDLTVNKNKNNVNGTFSIAGRKFFYKILRQRPFGYEVNGYKIIKKYYPVSNLVYHDSKTGLLLYEFDNSIGKNKGLVADLLGRKIKKSGKRSVKKILLLYKKVFLKTLKFKKSDSAKIFFHDRIKTRIEPYYQKRFMESLRGKELIFNNVHLQLDPVSTLKGIKDYFSKNKKIWCAISQCDPSELNIGLKPIIFDYLAGGYNPLMAEFATFIWYTLIQGNYLSLKYNRASYNNHGRVFSSMAKVKLQKNVLKHSVSKARKELISEYIKVVIKPVFHRIHDYNEWYYDFKHFFALRLLGVFNVRKMERKDQVLSFGYLEFFYNKINPKYPTDLINIINKL